MIKLLTILTLITVLLTGCKNPLGDADPFSDTFCAGNTDPTIDEECNPINQDPNTSVLSWDFLNSGDYSFDSNYVEIAGGTASLKTVDQSFSGSDFNSGSHVGTSVSGSAITLQTSSYAEHDSSWTPEYGDLVAYFKFNGSWDNEMGTGDFVAGGDATFTTSRALGTHAATFDGDGDSAALTFTGAAVLNFDDDFSISYWLAPDFEHDGAGGVFSRVVQFSCSTGYLLDNWLSGPDATTPGYANHYLYDGASAFGIHHNKYTSLGFHHVVYIKRDNFLELYIDGVAKPSVAITPLVTGATCSNVTIGFTNFKGFIDDMAIWNEAISSSQVTTIYNRQSATYADNTSLNSSWTPHWDNIVGYWKMDGNWQDSSGNGNHGTANGDATFHTDAKVGSQTGTFDGNGDYISINRSKSNTIGEDTISVWVKSNGSSVSTALSAIFGIMPDNGTQPLLIIQSTDNTQNDLQCSAGYNVGVFASSPYSNVVEDQWYHVVCTVSIDGSGNAMQRLYINGELFSSRTTASVSSYITASNNYHIGRQKVGTDRYYNGSIDEVAHWSIELSAADVKNIYSRQKQKYAGHYDSPVIDLGTSGNWTDITAATALPFGKEIVAQSSESSSDYSSLSGDLSSSLAGYWTFDEISAGGVSGSDFEDRSIYANHGTEFGTLSYNQPGVLSHSIYLSGDDRVDITDDGNLTFLASDSYTTSIWVKADGSQVDWAGIYTKISSGSNNSFSLQFSNHSPKKIVVFHNDSTLFDTNMTINDINDGSWHHIAIVRNATTIEVYLDGKNHFSGTYSVPITSGSGDLVIGDARLLNTKFQGYIDDFSIWKRLLSANEIQQLYRRGANRIKYQVKSCVDSSCNCKSYNTSPVGSASDCDGDGTPNSTDTDDIYMAEFIGPGGDGSTQYSELFNRALSDLTFNCTANTSDSDNDICVDDEITLEGDTNATSPSFTFADMATSAAPANNRYFQYRVLMEAEDNTACSGGPCLPELTSVEVGPTGRYYGGSPVVSSNSPLSFDNIQSMSFSEGGLCSHTYQLSPDGSTYYYFDGTNWVTAGSETVDLSSSSSQITSNISAFVNTTGTGNLYFKAFLNSDTTQACTLDNISLTKEVE